MQKNEYSCTTIATDKAREGWWMQAQQGPFSLLPKICLVHSFGSPEV